MRIRNWERYQHYNGRRPVWIKVYVELLDEPDFCDLPPESVRFLVMLWLMAAADEGRLPSPEKIAWRLRMPEAEVLRLLPTVSVWLEDLASNLLARPASNLLAHDASNLLAHGDSNLLAHTASDLLASVEERREEKENNTSGFVVDFEEAWRTHRRGSRQKAEEAYRKAVPSKVDHPTLMAALRSYVGTLRPDFRGAHLERWIRDGRWEEFDGDAPAEDSGLLDAGAASW